MARGFRFDHDPFRNGWEQATPAEREQVWNVLDEHGAVVFLAYGRPRLVRVQAWPSPTLAWVLDVGAEPNAGWVIERVRLSAVPPPPAPGQP